MVQRIHCIGVCAALVLGATAAEADSPKGRVVTLAPVPIVGRVQRPTAAVDVSRIEPKFTLGEPREPFLDRISKACSRDPY